MYDTSIFAVADGTLTENVPSGPVVVVVVVDLTFTVAPASGLPFSSVTFPVAVDWASAAIDNNSAKHRVVLRKSSFIIIFIVLVDKSKEFI
jgi:hypothetical protein